MSNVATIEKPVASITLAMAERYGMHPAAFEATLRATVVPKDCTKEQFAAFLLVANEYALNPITKEIYAFPTRSGGIQPVVSIDGWMNLCNSHPQMDGLEFDDHLDDKGDLTAVSARIWRKDRSHPIVVTEYMVECFRDTEPWKKWRRRMLRHKAAIQCARYAFGFAGIVDPDEAERMGADTSKMRDVTPPSLPPAPPPAPKRIAAPPAAEVPHDPETGEVAEDAPKLLPPAESAALKEGLLKRLAKCGTTKAIEAWSEQALVSTGSLQPADRHEVLREREARLAECYAQENRDETGGSNDAGYSLGG